MTNERKIAPIKIIALASETTEQSLKMIYSAYYKDENVMPVDATQNELLCTYKS